MTSTTQQMRSWQGPVILSYGFRPFFFGAAVWAALAMLLWVPMITGYLRLPTAFDPLTWHAHAFLFGYLTAVVAGFLLTAVPNWTGRLPIVGWPLGGLFALWIAGRFAVMFSAGMSPLLVAVIDLAMPVALAIVIAREIVAGKNWRNLIVLGMLGVLMLGNAVLHWEAARGDMAAQGYGLRIGLGAGLMMIAVIGGRIVPSFTRNWLVKQGAYKLPTPPMQRFDKIALLGLLVALVSWVALPETLFAALLLALAGMLHLARLTRWGGLQTRREPLVIVLHVAYFFVPVGALAMAVQIILPTAIGLGAVQHLWMSGAIGLMTLAVMTRATLGHTGQTLRAGSGTLAIYSAVMLATVLRVAADIWPLFATELYSAAGLAWLVAFGGFALLYGPLLLRAAPAKAL
ncbi:NnrS family protein [Cognatishimia sp. MH4019]|uniref:NnrS family protein n=1 Tax=Cognatishimia sp. MH4019 TaxID=2854030 RepID=UPI001CD7F4E3|nr:NnrS family protein [Cognatishimia sp. MH4019]